MDARTFDPGKAIYGGSGPPLAIPWPLIDELQLLADERSNPGNATSVSDLVVEAISAYVDKHAKKLDAIGKQAEADELERVAAVHGGEAA